MISGDNLIENAFTQSFAYKEDGLKKSDNPAKGLNDTIYTIDFNESQALEYTIPKSFFYFDEAQKCGRNWAELYVDLLSVIIEDYPHVFRSGMIFSKRGIRIELADKQDYGFMRCPKEIPGTGYMLETNLSAGSIAERIKYILDLCNIDYENVIITYSKRANNTNPNAEKLERRGQLKDKGTLKMIPNELIQTIMDAYKTGMRFDDTVLRLLEDKTGIEINASLVDALRGTMFMRSDGLYYLPEMIAGSDELDFIKSDVTAKLNEYALCESTCLYEEFSSRNFSNCLRDEKDYADFLGYLLPDIVRKTSIYGTKVIRPVSVSKGEAIGRLTEKLALKIRENGCLTEDELLEICPVISRDFMAKLIKKNTNDIVTTVINDMVCYQTIEIMGFDENFSDLLCTVLDKIDELNLAPSRETLKVLLSVEMGQNFLDAYSITDDKTFCRIIDMYYTGEKARAWRSGNYAEVE